MASRDRERPEKVQRGQTRWESLFRGSVLRPRLSSNMRTSWKLALRSQRILMILHGSDAAQHECDCGHTNVAKGKSEKPTNEGKTARRAIQPVLASGVLGTNLDEPALDPDPRHTCVFEFSGDFAPTGRQIIAQPVRAGLATEQPKSPNGATHRVLIG
jgi:hypothetical protein